MVDNALDYGYIINSCGIDKETTDVFLSNIETYTKNFSKSQLIDFYLYILNNVNNFEILTNVIKLTDSYQDEKILFRLLEILLLKNIDDKSDELINLRVMTIKSIAKYKDSSTVGTLLYCLNDKDENYKIRLACADALGRIGNKYAVESLIDVVKDEDEKSVYVKESATFALGLLGDVSAIDPLVAIMEAKQGVLGKFSFLKERIVEALGRLNLNNKKVLKVLKNALLDTSPMVRINAIEALMNSDYEEANSLIHKALHDDVFEVQKNALVALYNMNGRVILDEIMSLPSYSNDLKNEARELLLEYEEEL